MSEQSLYNLAERTVELEVTPACLHYGLAVLPWSPLAMGALAGGGVRSAKEWADKVRKRIGDRHGRWLDFCRAKGKDPAVVAVAWLLSRPGVTAPIIGPRTMAQFEQSLEALTLTLSDEDLAALDVIFPGPGGPAPEAYAW